MSEIVLEPCPGVRVYRNGGLEIGPGRAWPGGRHLRYTIGAQSLRAMTLRDEMLRRLAIQADGYDVYRVSLRHLLALYPTIVMPQDFASATEEVFVDHFRMSVTLPFGDKLLPVTIVISPRQLRPIMVHS